MLNLFSYSNNRKLTILNIIIYFTYRLLIRIKQNYRCYKGYVSTGVILRGTSAVFFDSRNITIGDNFSAGMDCKFYAQDESAKIFIGDSVALNDNVTINSDNGGCIEIGSDVIIGPGVVLRASNHIFDKTSVAFRWQGHKPGVIKIKDNVWLGANVIVLPGVVIGENVVIGAGSIVTKDIPNNSVAFGVPATVYRGISIE